MLKLETAYFVVVFVLHKLATYFILMCKVTV